MPELHWGETGFSFKEFAERLQVFKAQFIGDFADREARGRELFLGQFDQLVVQVLLRVLARQGFEQTAEVARGNI